MSAILACAAPLNKTRNCTACFRRVPQAWVSTSRAAGQEGEAVRFWDFCLLRLIRVPSAPDSWHPAEHIFMKLRCRVSPAHCSQSPRSCAALDQHDTAV